MITLQDIDNALDRAQILASVNVSEDDRLEILTCLHNARQMLIEIGQDSTAALERMTATLDSLSDITQGR